MDKRLVPPAQPKAEELRSPKCDWLTEYDVVTTLKNSGHEVLTLGVLSDLNVINQTMAEFKPHIVFNLMEMFDGDVTFDQNVVSHIELLGAPYTGCNPKGLILARDKAMTKKIWSFHGISSPDFFVFQRGLRQTLPKSMKYPLIIKCQQEESSYGICQASIVQNEEKLMERVDYIKNVIGDDALVEQFIEGREFYCGVIGNQRLETLPVWELLFENADKPEREIYSGRAKFNDKYRAMKGIKTVKADISRELEEKIQEICKEAYRALNLSGYARMDLRVDKENNIYLLEANPNPDVGRTEDFAEAANYAGITYDQLLGKMLTLGKSWHEYI